MAFSPRRLMRGASGTSAAATVDAQFNYVTMLLHGDGTNGAQNNTFLDSSTNAFSITRNGNTTQGSFSPYGSNWSNFFDGSGDYFTLTGANLSTGDVTFEFWIYPSDETVAYRCVYDTRIFGGSATSGFGVFQYGKVIEVYQASLVVSSAANSIAINAWNHVALVRNSGTCQLYVNGVASGSSNSNTTNLNSTERRIGNASTAPYYYFGYISNLREVTSALYTGTFTPSTTPLTAISGTSLLTCQSNRFIDNSTNAFAITVNGNPSVQRFNPFGTSTAYSTSVIGGSGYFDGGGDYLGCGSQSAYAFGTSNFTMECWAYATSFPYYNSLTGSRANQSDAANTAYSFGIDSGGSVYFYSAGFLVTSSAGAIKLNSWNHIALVRSGTGSNQSVLYINGVSAGTGTISNNLSGTSFAIGGLVNGDEPFTGYITNVRLNNTALYSTTFTPPTAPLTAVSGTSLLTNFTNGAIFDNAMMNDLETVGNAQISTSVKKYGTGSLAFDGTGDYLINASNRDVSWGTGDFTLEGWFYWNSLASESAIVWGKSVGWVLYVYPANKLQWGRVSPKTPANLLTGSTSLSTGQWYHIAVTRSNGTVKLWVNGVSDGSVSDADDYSASGQLAIGISHSSEYFNGYIDDLRITKGYARYTANTAAPTSAFSDTGPY